MSVETELGLSPDLGSVIVDAWAGWTALRPALGKVPDPCNLRAWRHRADQRVVDEVVYSLAWLASTDGGNDLDAAQVMAWLLVPGASFMARQLRGLAPGVDHVVASELWILVRTFPLHRNSVIPSLMRDLRTRVLELCEAPGALRRTDPTWFFTGGSIESPEIRSLPVDSKPTALDELLEVLEWAAEQRVIRADDRRLLLCLVEATEGLKTRNSAAHGLLANEATESVARLLGVSERTVRRRARASMQALAAAAPAYLRAAA